MRPHDNQIGTDNFRFAFERDLTVGSYTIHIKLTRRSVRSEEGAFLFGCPTPTEKGWPDPSDLTNDLNSMQVPFLYLQLSPGEISIASDIFGGFRVYYWQSDEEIHISDNFHYLASLMRRTGRIKPNIHEKLYWARQRFTTGGSTMIEGLRKLPPASMIEVTSDGFKLSCHFRNIDNRPSSSVHTELVEQSLTRSLQALQSQNRQIVLLFSGGRDSVLLAALMKEMGINPTLVFLKGQPGYTLNLRDHHRAVAVADNLGLPLVVVDVPLEIDVSRQREIILQMLPDRHFAVLHFEGMPLVAKMFGTDITVLVGEKSDSVLSYGPSSGSKGDFVARLLFNDRTLIARKIGALALSYKTGRKLRAPRDSAELCTSFYDSMEYYAVVDDKLPADYKRYIEDTVRTLSGGITSIDSLLMYLRLSGHMQGSDARVITQSCAAAGIDSVAFPFAHPDIVYATIQHKSKRLELFRPKYAVRDLLKRRGIRIPHLSSASDKKGDKFISSLQTNMNNLYNEEVERLFSQ